MYVVRATWPVFGSYDEVVGSSCATVFVGDTLAEARAYVDDRMVGSLSVDEFYEIIPPMGEGWPVVESETATEAVDDDMPF